jgi:hypothetical protein
VLARAQWSQTARAVTSPIMSSRNAWTRWSHDEVFQLRSGMRAVPVSRDPALGLGGVTAEHPGLAVSASDRHAGRGRRRICREQRGSRRDSRSGLPFGEQVQQAGSTSWHVATVGSRVNLEQ